MGDTIKALLLIIFAWFIDGGWKMVAFIALFLFFEWIMKSMIQDAIEQAMKKTVIPALNDIRNATKNIETAITTMEKSVDNVGYKVDTIESAVSSIEHTVVPTPPEFLEP